MIMTDPTAALYAALAKAQGAMSNPIKNREVSVKSDRGAYKFAYATLDAILDGIRKPLSENGLSMTQTLERTPEGMVMCLRLMHSNGGMVCTCMPLDQAKVVKMQEMGSVITFARRYQVASFFGLAAEEDDDANAADGNTVQAVKDKPPAKPTARDEFKRIRDAINAADDALSVADILMKEKDAIVAIKQASETGYQSLMAAKDAKLAALGGDNG
jgi:hypothetical protein